MKRKLIITALILATLACGNHLAKAAKPKSTPGEGITMLKNKGDKYMLLRKHFDVDFAAAKASKKASVEQWSRLVLIAADIPDRQKQCREAIVNLVNKSPDQSQILELADKLADHSNENQATYLLDTYVDKIYDTISAKIETQPDESLIANLAVLTESVNKYNCSTAIKMNELLCRASELTKTIDENDVIASDIETAIEPVEQTSEEIEVQTETPAEIPQN